MFDSFSFGHISYNGKDYNYDLIVDSNSVARERGPRETNHLLEAKELINYLEPVTKKIIIGTGDLGVLKLSDDARQLLESRRIEWVTLLSQKAIQLYNNEPDKTKVVAIIHSTC